MKRLVMVAMGLCAASAVAMPTQAELKKAQPLVVELMAPAMTAFKEAGAKDKAAAAVKVADASVAFAKAAETESAKFLLLKGAVSYYVRGEAYDKAADAVAALQETVKDVTPAVVAEITGKATGKISETKAPRLFAQYRAAKLQVRAASEAKSLALKLKRVKSDALQRRYAEALAVSGDWKKAYGEFAKLSDAKLKAVVEAEAKGKAKNAEAGEFWWAYEPAMEDADDIFKAHAAVFYRQALAAGEITGLKKNIVEQRIKPYGESAEVATGGQGTGASPRTPAANGLYCVIDLSGGPDAKKYPVSYMNDIPKGGWSDEYKTTKLVLRRIEQGAFMMGKTDQSRRVEIKKPFYIGVFEVSQKQWSLVMGDRPAFWKGPQWSLRPIEQVPYERLRGKNVGCKWPESDEVDAGSFMGLVRQKTGLRFDLPTEAQWEYACRAGTETDFYNNTDNVNWVRDSSLDKIGRYQFNGGWNEGKWGKFDWGKAWTTPDRNCEPINGTAAVGMYQPNNLGLYDMLGNVGEMCLDFEDATKVNSRVIRGGYWAEAAYVSTAHHRMGQKVDGIWFGFGFRLCLPLAGGAATQVPAATPAPAAKAGKAWQEKGNEATLTLKDGVKIEFVKCPAGDFKMLCAYGWEPQSFRARISRPFWITKMRITQQQISSIFPEIERLKPKSGNEKNAVSVAECLGLGLFDRLKEDFANSLPTSCKDYVFRLPSMAEYEYAYHANTHDRKDPYIHIDQKNLSKQDNADMVSLNKKCGENKPNAWGIHDLFSCMTFLDRLDSSNSVINEKPGEGFFKNFYGVKSVIKPKDGTDPFFWTEAESYYAASSWHGQFSFGRNGIKDGVAGEITLVIGPDLVKEWKAKNGKK